jgi:hypothetical protein
MAPSSPTLRNSLRFQAVTGVRSPAVTFYSPCHRENGPVATYETEEEARRDLEAVLRDEPDWVDQMFIEPFDFVVMSQQH